MVRLPSGERDPAAIRRCLKTLFTHGADLDALNHEGRTALHLCSTNLDAAVVEVLIDLGADANLPSVDDVGATALQLVCLECAAEAKPEAVVSILEMLLPRGAQPNVRDIQGNTALHMLLENETMSPATKAAAVAVLVSYGARTDISNDQGVTCASLISNVSPRKGLGIGSNNNPLEASISLGSGSWKAKGGVSVPSDFEASLMDKALWSNGDSMGDNTSKRCTLCSDQFSFTKRQHHCRHCGRLICGNCSSKKLLLPTTDTLKLSSTDSVRVCDGCFNKIKTDMVAKAAMQQQHPPAAPSSTRRRSSAADEQAKFDKDKWELLGRSTEDAASGGPAGTARALADRAMGWLTGDTEQKQTSAGANVQKSRLLASEMDQLKDGLNRRGEKLSNLADKTSELADSSAQFAALAKALNEQQSNKFSLW